MKKILFISYFFPPTAGVGRLRLVKFIKYLPQSGWEPSVLTVKRAFYPLRDESLVQEIPPQVTISRTSYFEPAFWFKYRLWQSFLAYFLYPIIYWPDNQILWFLPALITAYRIIKKEKIKIIFTSSVSLTDHLVAWTLRKILCLSWVADFRDEWTINPTFFFPTPLHRWLAKIWEKKITETADQVTTVSPPLTKYFKNLTSKKDKVITLTNGFDGEDFQEKLPKPDKKYCRIVHAGSLYASRQPYYFFQALAKLKLKNVKVDFLGGKNHVPHHQAVRAMRQADILLLILNPYPRPAVLTAKLYEYLAAQKPILTLAPQETQVSKLIQKLKIGEVADPQDQKAIEQKLLKMYQNWLIPRRSLPRVNLEKYSYKNLAKNLAKIFQKLEKKSPHFAKASRGKHKIKICFIGNIRSPQNQSLCRALAAYDYEIHFISTDKGNFPGIKIYPLGQSYGDKFTPFFFLRSVLKIRRIVKKVKPDIVHGQDLIFGGIWAYLAGSRPYVVTPWGSDVMNYKQFISLEKYLIRKTLRAADLVTVSSLALLKKAHQIGMPKEKAQLVHFGIDLDIFRPKNNPLQKQKIIFCPRAIGPVYNIDILIQAFVLVLKKEKMAKLALRDNIADEDYLLKVEQLIIKYNLVDKVIFLPKVSLEKMNDYYNQAAVVASITSSDGCSVSFLEAMACEKKIVATDLPYIQEWLLVDTRSKMPNLWLAPVRDVQKTAQAILAALKYPLPKWRKIGRANRQMVAERAELKSNAEKLDRMYRELNL